MLVEHVAVGILINKEKQVLISQRPAHKHMGNKWEFPGGKVEDGENSQEALCREMREELGIIVEATELLTDVIYDYGSKKVILDVYNILKWSGEAQGMENQAIRWVEKNRLAEYDFPEANEEIIGQI